MKDQVFSGRDVAEALHAAGRALGLSPDGLRYVVLERGSPGVLGMGATPARIAVLLDGQPPQPPAAGGPGGDPREGILGMLRALAEAAEIDIAVVIEEGDQALCARLSGAGTGFFLEREGEVLKAVEHLLQRMFARQLAPRRLTLDCEGYREARDEALRARARALAAAVRGDGVPRTTEPLNSYERRVIHLALNDEAGVRTFSVGEGSERRVTVAPAPQGEESTRGEGRT